MRLEKKATVKHETSKNTRTIRQIMAAFMKGSGICMRSVLGIQCVFKEEIRRIRASIEEVRGQNCQIVKTLKDIHAVLAAINTQVTELILNTTNWY